MTTYKWHATTPLTVAGAKEFWDLRYGHGVTPWDRGGCNPALVRWLDRGELDRCRVLVPGCGRGHEVIELARRGLDVTAVDLAPTALDTLAGALAAEGLSADLVHADFEPAPGPAAGHGAEHLTQTGVVVPAGSAPAHIYIVPDATFTRLLDAWGLAAVRMRFRPERGETRP